MYAKMVSSESRESAMNDFKRPPYYGVGDYLKKIGLDVNGGIAVGQEADEVIQERQIKNKEN